MKTIEFYLITKQGMTKDYIQQNIVTYDDFKAKDWLTGKIFKLVPKIEGGK